MKIQVRGEDFIFDTSRSVIWPAQKMMMIADIHLGKAQTFIKNGLWLPPAAHTGDLNSMMAVATQYSVEHVVFLGDFVHSLEGITANVVEEFVDWKNNFAGRITVIIGNHDRPTLKYWPQEWSSLKLVDVIKIGDFILQHEPPAKNVSEFTWCGHIHPKIKLNHAGDQLYLPSFVITPKIGYLPAYSSLAGGAKFSYQKKNRYFVSSDDKVLEVFF